MFGREPERICFCDGQHSCGFPQLDPMPVVADHSFRFACIREFSPASETVMRGLTRLVRLARMPFDGEWREPVIRLNRRIGSRWFDFEKAPPEAYGLDATLARGHQASSYDLEVALAGLPISRTDAILDVGCGKGRALITMSRFPFGAIAGIELSPEMAEIARRNMRRIGLGKRVRILCADAAEYDGLDDYTYFYCFNPFGRETMTRFMERLASSLRRRPREARIVYNTPLEEPAILASGRFVAERTIVRPGKAPVTIYRNSARAPRAAAGDRGDGGL